MSGNDQMMPNYGNNRCLGAHVKSAVSAESRATLVILEFRVRVL